MVMCRRYKYLVIVLFLILSVQLSGQVIPGVVASSRQVSNPELITNGSFSVDANWTKSDYCTITGGEAVFNVGANYDETLSQGTLDFTLNETYTIEFDITNYSSGRTRVLLGNLSTYCTLNNVDYMANGHYSFDLIYDNASAPKSILFYCLTYQPHLHVDNVSVKLKP